MVPASLNTENQQLLYVLELGIHVVVCIRTRYICIYTLDEVSCILLCTPYKEH